VLTGLPEDQAVVALRFLQDAPSRREVPVVSDLVVAEAYYALCYHYEVPKNEAVKQLSAFLESGWVETPGVATSALKDCKEGRPGLVDRMIRLDYLRAAAGLVTFDKRLAKMGEVRLLS
jgi:hypothetical protein